MAVVTVTAGTLEQLQNPTRAEPVLRALFIALDNWVTKDQQPPPSEVPDLTGKKDGVKAQVVPEQLTGIVSKKALGWPDIPGVTYTGLITIRFRFDYGPRFEQGIWTIIPGVRFTSPPTPAWYQRSTGMAMNWPAYAFPRVAAPVATLRDGPYEEKDSASMMEVNRPDNRSLLPLPKHSAWQQAIPAHRWKRDMAPTKNMLRRLPKRPGTWNNVASCYRKMCSNISGRPKRVRC